MSTSRSKFAIRSLLVFLAAWTGLFAQLTAGSVHTGSFTVTGVVRSYPANSSSAGVKLEFVGKNIKKYVVSNAKGAYRIQLPLGAYTMNVSTAGVDLYQRPILRVLSPRTIVVDVTTYPPDPDCDTIVSSVTLPDGTTKTQGLTVDDYKDSCGGSDELKQPSDGTPFSLYVRYSSRRRADDEVIYSSDRRRGPVFAAYNLLSLEADSVVYDSKTRTITATGNVAMADGSGKTQHFDSIGFRIEDGHAIILK